MRVVVTGGAGFIGSHVVERLLRQGAHVSVMDNLSTGEARNLVDAFRLGLAENDVHLCDISDRHAESLIRALRPDVVVHLAARTSVAESCVDPVRDAVVNVAGTANVIQASVLAGVKKIVFAASCAIYGEVDECVLPVGEHQDWRPVSPYGASKEAGIRYLQVARRAHRIDYAVLVMGNVYGPRQRPPGVIPAFLDAFAAGTPPSLHGLGSQTRDFVHVTDVAEAFSSACTRGSELVANVGSGVETSVRDIYERLAAAAGYDDRSVKFENRIQGVTRMCLDVRRAASALAWTPRVSLNQGLDQLGHSHHRRMRRAPTSSSAAGRADGIPSIDSAPGVGPRQLGNAVTACEG